MEPHRHRPGTGPQVAARPRRTGGEASGSAHDHVDYASDSSGGSASREWLEHEALRSVARSESSRRAVCERLEHRIAKRSERTGEDQATLRALIPEIVARLVERGYLDDRRFGEQLVARLRRQGRSRAGIRARLEAKGLAQELILELIAQADPALEREQEIRAAFALARKRRIGPYHVDRTVGADGVDTPDTSDATSRRALRDRHLAILARQGFSRETSICVIDAEAPPETE